MPLILTFPVGAAFIRRINIVGPYVYYLTFKTADLLFKYNDKKEVNIMSYQFIHIEDYGRVVSKKTKNNGSNDKYKKETKGRSVREIIAEAKRENGNCPHVENPKDPILLFGVGLDEVEKLAYEYHDNTKITDKNGKEKKLRSDANILLAGVVSLNKDNKDIWDDYKFE